MITAGTGSLKWFSADCYNNPIPYACTYDPQLIGKFEYSNLAFSIKLMIAQMDTHFQIMSAIKLLPKRTKLPLKLYVKLTVGISPAFILMMFSFLILVSSDFQENVFILNLATNYSSMELYARIGLKEVGNNNTYSWLDGSPLGTYSNFGLGVNSNLGNCVGMSLKDDVIKSGEWINTKCEHSLISVCKRGKFPSVIKLLKILVMPV